MSKDDDIIDAEVLEELAEPDWEFEEKSKKKPRGTRKKDFPAFTAKNRLKILEMATLGAAPEICADYAGVHPQTLARWLERGDLAQARVDEGEEEELAPVEIEFATFYMAFRQARATAAANPIATIAREAKENWKAAVVWLEKQRPDLYAARQALEISGHTTQDIRIGEGSTRQKAINTDELARRLSTDQLKRIRADVIKSKKLLKAGDEEVDED